MKAKKVWVSKDGNGFVLAVIEATTHQSSSDIAAKAPSEAAAQHAIDIATDAATKAEDEAQSDAKSDSTAASPSPAATTAAFAETTLRVIPPVHIPLQSPSFVADIASSSVKATPTQFTAKANVHSEEVVHVHGSQSRKNLSNGKENTHPVSKNNPTLGTSNRFCGLADLVDESQRVSGYPLRKGGLPKRLLSQKKNQGGKRS